MKPFKLISKTLIAILAISTSAASFSLPLMDIQIDSLTMQLGDLKKTLNLNANQLILWQQTEAKSAAIIRERKMRRERLQAGTVKFLGDPGMELRELAGKVDAEADVGVVEEKKLRELWLTVNDALDEHQRQIVINFFAEQLQRTADYGVDKKPAREKDESHSRNGGRKRSGGSMGGDSSRF